MITQRAFIVGFVGFCFYLIAIVNSLPYVFYALTWLTVSILASSLGIALLSLVGLDCKWESSGARVTERLEEVPEENESSSEFISTSGQASGPSVELELTNNGSLNKTGVIIEVQLRDCRREVRLNRRFLLEALPAGLSLSSTLQISDLPRGRYRITGLRLIGSDVLGLFRMQRMITTKHAGEEDAAAHDLIVGPATVGLLNSKAATEGGGAQGEGSAVRYLGSSDELRGTRPYVAGDDLRRVHWKSTARHGGLVVKEFHRTTRAQAVVVWDGALADEDDGPAVEFSLRLAASLCRAFAECGRSCSLLRMDAHAAGISSGGQADVTAGAIFLSRVTEFLAHADADRATPLSHDLKEFLHLIPVNSDVYIVSHTLNQDLQQSVMVTSIRNTRVTIGLVDPRAPEREDQNNAMPHRWLRKRERGLVQLDAATKELLESLRLSGVRLVDVVPSGASFDSTATLRYALRATFEGAEVLERAFPETEVLAAAS